MMQTIGNIRSQKKDDAQSNLRHTIISNQASNTPMKFDVSPLPGNDKKCNHESNQTVRPDAYKCLSSKENIMFQATATANVKYSTSYQDIAAIEAQKAEERERIKREKVENFKKSLKTNLNTKLAQEKRMKISLVTLKLKQYYVGTRKISR